MFLSDMEFGIHICKDMCRSVGSELQCGSPLKTIGHFRGIFEVYSLRTKIRHVNVA